MSGPTLPLSPLTLSELLDRRWAAARVVATAADYAEEAGLVFPAYGVDREDLAEYRRLGAALYARVAR